MYVHTTILRVNPKAVVDVIHHLNNSEYSAYCSSMKGFRQAYLLESQEEAGKIIVLTFWDSPSNARTLFFDPQYARLLSGIRQFMLAPLERIGYALLGSLPTVDQEVQDSTMTKNSQVQPNF